MLTRPEEIGCPYVFSATVLSNSKKKPETAIKFLAVLCLSEDGVSEIDLETHLSKDNPRVGGP